MLKRLVWIIVLILLPYHLFAATYFYCSYSSQYAHLGDGLSQVKAKCGAPASVKNQLTTTNKIVQGSMWVYNFSNAVANASSVPSLTKPINPLPSTAGEAALIINLVNHKVESIVQYGRQVDSTNFCSPNNKITIGDTELKVRYYCSGPSSTQQVTWTEPQDSYNQTVLTYNQAYASPITMTFGVDGKLISITP